LTQYIIGFLLSYKAICGSIKQLDRQQDSNFKTNILYGNAKIGKIMKGRVEKFTKKPLVFTKGFRGSPNRTRAKPLIKMLMRLIVLNLL
jgi:hypothetical protein